MITCSLTKGEFRSLFSANDFAKVVAVEKNLMINAPIIFSFPFVVEPYSHKVVRAQELLRYFEHHALP